MLPFVTISRASLSKDAVVMLAGSVIVLVFLRTAYLRAPLLSPVVKVVDIFVIFRRILPYPSIEQVLLIPIFTEDTPTPSLIVNLPLLIKSSSFINFKLPVISPPLV